MLSLQAGRRSRWTSTGVARPKCRSVGATDVAWLPLGSARVGRAAQAASWRCLEAAPGVILPTNMNEWAVYLANVGELDLTQWALAMLFLGVAHFRSGTQKKHDALIGAFSAHLMQPMNPRIRLAGPIFDDSGARSGLFMLLEADSIETIRSFLKHGPYV